MKENLSLELGRFNGYRNWIEAVLGHHSSVLEDRVLESEQILLAVRRSMAMRMLSSSFPLGRQMRMPWPQEDFLSPKLGRTLR